MKVGDKLYCIKELIVDAPWQMFEFFEGNYYTIEEVNKDEAYKHVRVKMLGYYFNLEEINDYFKTLSQIRKEKIDQIEKN